MREQYIPEEAAGFIPPAEVPQKTSTKIKKSEVAEVAEEKVTSELNELGLDFDQSLSLEQNKKRAVVFNYFTRKGLIEKNDQGFVFDVDGLKNYSFGGDKVAIGSKFSKKDLFIALYGLDGYDKKMLIESGYSSEIRPSPTMVLPKNLDELFTGYDKEVDKGLFNPWDFAKNSTENSWGAIVTLESGETTSMAEMFFSKRLIGDMKARRSPTGDLEIKPDDLGPYKRMASEDLRKKDFNFTVRDDQGKSVTLAKNSLLFSKVALPNFFSKGFFRASDFRRLGRGEGAEIFNTHERTLTPKAPYLTFTNRYNQSSKYYIGRDKIVGTGIPIKHETMKAVLLDPDTAAIVDNVHGKLKILYTFPLLSEQEGIKLREGVREKLIQKGQPVRPELISSKSVLGGKEMSARIRSYEVTSFIPPRADEKGIAYAKRVADLADARHVMDIATGFFEQARFGTSNLPWQEQLILANALTVEKDKDKLIKFSRDFGINGLRALTSADYGPEYVNKIINFAEKNPNYAKKLFGRYRRLIDNITDIIKNIDFEDIDISQDQKKRLPIELKEGLLRRAADLLAAGPEIVANKTSLSEKDHIEGFKGLNKLLSIIKDFSGQGSRYEFRSVLSEQQSNPSMPIRFMVIDKESGSEYILKFFIRPEAEKNAEARINIELSFDTNKPDERLKKLFTQTNTLGIEGKKKTRVESVLRVGLDMSNAQGDPRLSLDLGRNEIHNEKIDRTGDVLAKILALSSEQGSHNEQSFSDYSDDFSKIASSFSSFLQRRFAELSPQEKTLSATTDQKL